jgi:hypothetical protein
MAFIFYLHASKRHKSLARFLSHRKAFDLTSSLDRADVFVNAHQTLQAWFRKHPNQPVRVMADDPGGTMVLPPHMADEIRNDPRLHHGRWLAEVRTPGHIILPDPR